jgi:hypothetical protein
MTTRTKTKTKTKAKAKAKAPKAAATRSRKPRGYDRSHPWFYVLGGEPLPVDQVVPEKPYEPVTERKAPTFDDLDDTKRALEHAVARYEDLVNRGEDALSSYEKMFDNDPGDGEDDGPRYKAIHGALAAAYNGVLHQRSRLAYLRKALKGQGRPLLLIDGIEPPPRPKRPGRRRDRS